MAFNHLMQQNFRVFLPLTQKTSNIQGKFINRIIPLFPNYLFMGTERNQISWKSVNSTRGVSKVITLDGKYRAVHNEVIEGLMSRCDAKGIIQTRNNISIDYRAKIDRGAFSDFIVTVEKLESDERAWVLIDILQQKTRTSVSVKNLSKIG